MQNETLHSKVLHKGQNECHITPHGKAGEHYCFLNQLSMQLITILLDMPQEGQLTKCSHRGQNGATKSSSPTPEDQFLNQESDSPMDGKLPLICSLIEYFPSGIPMPRNSSSLTLRPGIPMSWYSSEFQSINDCLVIIKQFAMAN